MNKKSHLRITGKIAGRVPEKDRKWFLLGSIMPDLLVHTYLRGHTWESSFGSICKMMYKLEKNGKDNRYSYLMAGYVLHYVEDFFTLAHNHVFEGGLLDHIIYEKKMSAYIQEHNEPSAEETDYIMPLSATVEYLKQSHSEYLKKAGDMKTDVRYIHEAAEIVGNCLLHAIEINSMEEREMEPLSAYAFSDYRKLGL